MLKKVENTVSNYSGEIFIVPNALCRNDESGLESWQEERAERFGINPDSLIVQVWVTSDPLRNDGSDNWCNHKMPSYIGSEFGSKEPHLSEDESIWLGSRRFPSAVPVSWFDGVDDGDCITLESEGNFLTLKCNQKGYRYKRFGTIKETLAGLGYPKPITKSVLGNTITFQSGNPGDVSYDDAPIIGIIVGIMDPEDDDFYYAVLTNDKDYLYFVGSANSLSRTDVEGYCTKALPKQYCKSIKTDCIEISDELLEWLK